MVHNSIDIHMEWHHKNMKEIVYIVRGKKTKILNETEGYEFQECL